MTSDDKALASAAAVFVIIGIIGIALNFFFINVWLSAAIFGTVIVIGRWRKS